AAGDVDQTEDLGADEALLGQVRDGRELNAARPPLDRVGEARELEAVEVAGIGVEQGRVLESVDIAGPSPQDVEGYYSVLLREIDALREVGHQGHAEGDGEAGEA